MQRLDLRLLAVVVVVPLVLAGCLINAEPKGDCSTSADCDDSVACTVDVCDRAGTCQHIPSDAMCTNGQVCDATNGCQGGTITQGCTSDADCDDGVYCNGAETCGAGGTCQPGTPPSCDDGITCTIGVCDEATKACVQVPDNSVCATGSVCVQGVGCSTAQSCTTDADCDDGSYCNGVEKCTSGVCVHGTAPDCADSVACTADLCDDSTQSCVHVPDGSACASGVCDPTSGCVPFGIGGSASEPAKSCAQILTVDRNAADGFYWIDPDGSGAFQVYCDMTTAGGGWTLIASFNNGDAMNWTDSAADGNNIGNWTTTTGFGTLASWQTADYKGDAFWRLSGTDLLAIDSSGGWAAYEGALANTSLQATLAPITSCQTGVVPNVTVTSSDPIVQQYGAVAWFAEDPNGQATCGLNDIDSTTDSAVVALAQEGCGTNGFGCVGASSTPTPDRDFNFCLATPTFPNSDMRCSCPTWYGGTYVCAFDVTGCTWAALLVR